MRTTIPPAEAQPAQQCELERADSKASHQASELNFQKEWWMDAVVALLQEQLADQARQLQGALAEDLGGAVTALMRQQLADQAQELRRAVAEEMGALLAEGGRLRRAVRSDVEAALKSWGDQVAPRPSKPVGARSSKSRRVHEEGKVVEGKVVQGVQGCGMEGAETGKSVEDLGRSDSRRSIETAGGDHLMNFVQNAASMYNCRAENDSQRGDETMWRAVLHKGDMLQAWLRGLVEPPRLGRFARFVDGKVLEATACCMIFLNFAFMVYAANVEIQNPGETDMSVLIGNWIFQVFYTLEVFLKLSVHRQWFFLNENWKRNVFDFTLMALGFITLSIGNGVGNLLRISRLLKFGRSARVVRVMAHMKQLRALLLCLQGSLLNLFWTVVMLFTVYVIFSLFLMQVIAGYLQETGEALDESVFHETFGSVEASVLTLYKASTGGDDWSKGYDTIQVAGGTGCVIYLLFIVFVQFALMNIITGIFVESAMVTLSPSWEMRAQEHSRQEQENAKKLELLCKNVDSDFSGKLTQNQFEDGLRQQHIPMLLTMLGLQRHQVLEFFAYMADAANDDGQVEISAFVSGCMLLKGGATNFDLHKLHAEFHAQQAKLDENLSAMFQLLRDRLEPLEDPWESSELLRDRLEPLEEP